MIITKTATVICTYNGEQHVLLITCFASAFDVITDSDRCLG